MANTGENDNGSQFFITLDRADELTKKHTLFGRVKKKKDIILIKNNYLIFIYLSVCLYLKIRLLVIHYLM